MQHILTRWEQLRKAIDHSKSIASVNTPTPKKEEFPTVSSEHLNDVKYGVDYIPGSGDFGSGSSTDEQSIGHTKVNGKNAVIRHGAAAHRTAVEHEMSKLLGADHMVANQSYDSNLHHPEHYMEPSFDKDRHAGTSLQEHTGGRTIYDAQEDPKGLDDLKNQWKKGDLHKLWALHYISNNLDMHPGNFSITKGGVKTFDSDHAFYELPQAHLVIKDLHGGKPKMEYVPYATNMLPSYLSPFIENEEDIPHNFSKMQVDSKSINEHANNINPELFQSFGKHAYERAVKAKDALMSPDPTESMKKLWTEHHNKTR